MIQLYIDWDFISPSLKICSGILYIFKQEYKAETGIDRILLLKCKVKREQHSIGYSSIDEKEYSGDLFEKYREQIDILVNSYYKGMILKNCCYHWTERK